MPVGGEAPNVIPARAEARYMIRSATVARMGELREKVRRCFEAGALALSWTALDAASKDSVR